MGDTPEGVLWVHVGDGGNDDFRFMHRCSDEHFLLRVAHNRLLAWDGEVEPEMRKLRDYARTLPCQQRFTLKVSATPKRPAHVAQMCLARSEVMIPAPAQGPPAWRDWPPIRAWVLRRWEEEAPAEQQVDPFVVQVLRKLKWPAASPIAAHCCWYGVAQLEGYLGRKRDSPPGWQSVWHGWRYLQDLVTGARLYVTDSPRR